MDLPSSAGNSVNHRVQTGKTRRVGFIKTRKKKNICELQCKLANILIKEQPPYPTESI